MAPNTSLSQSLNIGHIKKDFALELTPYIDFLEDKSGQLTIDDINKNELIKNKFSPLLTKGTNLGLTQSTFWFRLEVKGTEQEQNFLLQLDKVWIDHMLLSKK